MKASPPAVWNWMSSMRSTGTVLSAFLLAVLVLGIWFFVASTDDDSFRDSQAFFGYTKVIESEFQGYFYGRPDYPAYTLEELGNKGILDKGAMQIIRDYHGIYRPFRPDTPPDTVVLHLGSGFFDSNTFDFTKERLTRNPKQ